MLHVHRVERLEELACLGEVWDALLRPDDPVFLGHVWCNAWFQSFAKGRAPCVLVVSENQVVRGILPLAARRTIPTRRLDLLANGHSPCADLVATPDHESDVVLALAHYLQEIDLAWDVATFAEVRRGSRIDALCARFPAGLRLDQPQRESPYVRLTADWDAYRASLSKNFQKVLRNNRNRVARAGQTAIELLESPAAVEAALDDVFAIGEKSWQGRAASAVGSTAANRAFYTAIARALSRRGLLRLWFLRLGGERVAFELHVVHAGVEYGLKTGYDLRLEDAGVGTFLDQSIVERLCADRAVHEYDLLGNADFYKRRWTDATRAYHRITLFGSGAPGRLASLWNLRLKPVLRQARERSRRGALS